MANWKFAFRDDQCKFIAAAMDYIIDRCDERINGTGPMPFDKWTSRFAKSEAEEIRDEIRGVMG